MREGNEIRKGTHVVGASMTPEKLYLLGRVVDVCYMLIILCGAFGMPEMFSQ